jgi:hypothetical protein
MPPYKYGYPPENAKTARFLAISWKPSRRVVNYLRRPRIISIASQEPATVPIGTIQKNLFFRVAAFRSGSRPAVGRDHPPSFPVQFSLANCD